MIKPGSSGLPPRRALNKLSSRTPAAEIKDSRNPFIHFHQHNFRQSPNYPASTYLASRCCGGHLCPPMIDLYQHKLHATSCDLLSLPIAPHSFILRVLCHHHYGNGALFLGGGGCQMQLKTPQRFLCCPPTSFSIVLWGYTQWDTYDITWF